MPLQFLKGHGIVISRTKRRGGRVGKCPYILEILGIIPAQILRGYRMDDTYEEKRGTGMRRYISEIFLVGMSVHNVIFEQHAGTFLKICVA